jgi:acetyl-CoA acyltransferase
MQEAYIVAGFRTAVTKSKKGGLRFFRPDDLAVEVIKGLVATIPQLDPKRVDDVIVGNAVPEAEQGLQFGRIISAKALGIDVAGFTINRYCASGLESIALATAKIRSGMAECIIAGGAESMSLVPTAGWKTVPSYAIAKDEPDYYLSMGLTAEAVSKEFNINRTDDPIYRLYKAVFYCPTPGSAGGKRSKRSIKRRKNTRKKLKWRDFSGDVL